MQEQIEQIEQSEPSEKRTKFQQIEQDVLQLKESMDILQELVQDQQAPIDTIETFIEESKHNVNKAHTSLVQAQEYKSAFNYIKVMVGSIFVATIYLLL